MFILAIARYSLLIYGFMKLNQWIYSLEFNNRTILTIIDRIVSSLVQCFFPKVSSYNEGMIIFPVQNCQNNSHLYRKIHFSNRIAHGYN